MKIDKSANLVLLTKLAAAAINYIFVIILARTMAAEDFGLISSFLTGALLFSVVGSRGQQLVLLKFVANLRVANRNQDIAALARKAFRKVAAGTFGIFALCMLTAIVALGLQAKNAIDLHIAVLGFFLIPLVGWIDAQSHFARGLGHIQLSLIPKEILWRGICGLLLIGFFSGGARPFLPIELALVVLSGVLVIVTLGQKITLAQKFGFLGDLIHVPCQSQQAEWAGASRPLWINSVSNIFLSNADVLFVALLVGPQESGFYFAANRLAQGLGFFSTSYNIVTSTNLASSWFAGDKKVTAEILRNSALKSSIPTLLAAAILWFFSEEFLSLFGSGFLIASATLKILILAGVLNALAGPADLALNMCGFEKQALGVSVASLILSVVSLTAGAVLLGSIGVAAAALAITMFRKTAYWLLAWRLMSLRSDAFATTLGAMQPGPST